MTFLQPPKQNTHTHTHTISYIYLLESGPCTDRQGNTCCIAIWHDCVCFLKEFSLNFVRGVGSSPK
jgi:hypothetical protein